MTNKTMWPTQPPATVFDILEHIRTTSPTSCFWCKKNLYTVGTLASHIQWCWMKHRKDVIRAEVKDQESK